MFIELLLSSPVIAFAWVLAIFFSLTVHEFSHALVAKWCGDRTAEREGRLTLNPIAHIDPVGLIMLFIIGFGWAKPVPFNPYNLKDPKWDSVKIALAGPASNLILAGVCGLALRLLTGNGIIDGLNLLTIFLFLMILLNLFLLFFNLVPIHPLDGSKLFFALFDHPKYVQLRNFVAIRGPQILLGLIVISFLTPFNVFFFVTIPSFFICDTIIGGSCMDFFRTIFDLI